MVAPLGLVQRIALGTDLVLFSTQQLIKHLDAALLESVEHL